MSRSGYPLYALVLLVAAVGILATSSVMAEPLFGLDALSAAVENAAERWRAGTSSRPSLSDAVSNPGVDLKSDAMSGPHPIADVSADPITKTDNMPFGDVDSDGVADREDNCPEAPNPLQRDHDQDGLGDRCDPGTYDFTALSPGDAPASLFQETLPEVAALDVVNTPLGSALKNSGPMWVVHQLIKLSGPRRHLDMDVTVDVTPDPSSVFAFELWSEGSALEKAGSGIEFTLSLAGLAIRKRTGYRRKPVGIAKLPRQLQPRHLQRLNPPQPLRFRVRLRKLNKAVTRIHVDWWFTDRWIEDSAVISMGGDQLVLGRHVALVHFGKESRPLLRLTAKGLVPDVPISLSRSFDGLEDWRVFQRGPDGSASISVPFGYRAVDPVVLEASVVDQTSKRPLSGFGFSEQRWDLPPAPGGQFGDVDLSDVPEGGNYDLEVRLLDAATGDVIGTDVIRHIGVGDIFLAAGQSNMSGYPLSMEPTEEPTPLAHLFGNDYQWKQASEPMDDGKNQSDLVSLDFPQHSLMLRFAKILSSETNVPVAVIPSSHGRTSLHKAWQRDPDDHTRRNSFYGSALYRALAASNTYPIKGVIWYQGESDYMDRRPAPSYAQKIRELVEHFRRDLDNPDLFFITCQLATHSRADFERWMPYQDLQRRHAAEDPRAVLVPTLDFPRNDPVHLSIEGVKLAGERVALAALHLVHGQGAAPGPRLLLASRPAARPRQVSLTYDREVKGGQPSLFLVEDELGEVRIVKLRTEGDTIVLTLERDLSASGRIQYGRVREPGGVAFVYDSSGVAPAFLDVKIANEGLPRSADHPSVADGVVGDKTGSDLTIEEGEGGEVPAEEPAPTIRVVPAAAE